MYTIDMSTLSITQARSQLSKLIDQSRQEAVFLEKHGKTEAVIVSAERYKILVEALEEIEDVQAFDEAMKEEGENISWEQAKADLGW